MAQLHLLLGLYGLFVTSDWRKQTLPSSSHARHSLPLCLTNQVSTISCVSRLRALLLLSNHLHGVDYAVLNIICADFVKVN